MSLFPRIDNPAFLRYAPSEPGEIRLNITRDVFPFARGSDSTILFSMMELCERSEVSGDRAMDVKLALFQAMFSISSSTRRGFGNVLIVGKGLLVKKAKVLMPSAVLERLVSSSGLKTPPVLKRGDGHEKFEAFYGDEFGPDVRIVEDTTGVVGDGVLVFYAGESVVDSPLCVTSEGLAVGTKETPSYFRYVKIT